MKQVLGELPFTAEVYWRCASRASRLAKSFSLRKLERSLPDWCAQALAAASQPRQADEPGQRILIFATLRYWIEHAALLGVALAGLGHQVTLAYLPYANWRKPLNRFDLRRQNAYAGSVLQQAHPLIQTRLVAGCPAG